MAETGSNESAGVAVSVAPNSATHLTQMSLISYSSSRTGMWQMVNHHDRHYGLSADSMEATGTCTEAEDLMED